MSQVINVELGAFVARLRCEWCDQDGVPAGAYRFTGPAGESTAACGGHVYDAMRASAELE